MTRPPPRCMSSVRDNGGSTEPARPIDCGNSGTGIRLLTGLLAGQDFFTVLTGDDSIRRRPMGRIVKPIRTMGAAIAGRKGGELAPLAMSGSRLHGITYASPVASAQIKSALLLAALYAEGLTQLTEPRLSRDHTERMFRYLGIPFKQEGTIIEIEGRPSVGWTSPGNSLRSRGSFFGGFFSGWRVTSPRLGCDHSQCGRESHPNRHIGCPHANGGRHRADGHTRAGRRTCR